MVGYQVCMEQWGLAYACFSATEMFMCMSHSDFSLWLFDNWMF